MHVIFSRIIGNFQFSPPIREFLRIVFSLIKIPFIVIHPFISIALATQPCISISVRPKIRFRRISGKNKSFGEKVAEFSAQNGTTKVLKI